MTPRCGYPSVVSPCILLVQKISLIPEGEVSYKERLIVLLVIKPFPLKKGWLEGGGGDFSIGCVYRISPTREQVLS